jgi:tyrosinase
VLGIHGRPYLPFDGVVAGPEGQGHGYCTHVSNLFPTWHGPYLALYEVSRSRIMDIQQRILIYKQQVLHGLVQQIAAMYPEGEVRDKFTTAAQNFRIPYWDWAAAPPVGQSVFPSSICGLPSVDADGPAGVQAIANPLYSYQFQPLNTTQLPNPPVSFK